MSEKLSPSRGNERIRSVDLLPPVSADELVADAMIFGYAHLFRDPLVFEGDTIAEVSERNSVAQCFETSVRALYFLSSYQKHFQRLLLLGSRRDYDAPEPPFTRHFLGHYAWCAIAHDGTTFIGSPNNANKSFIYLTGTNPLSTIHQDKTLAGALEKFGTYEGNVWASAEDINKIPPVVCQLEVLNKMDAVAANNYQCLHLDDYEQLKLRFHFRLGRLDFNNKLRFQFQTIETKYHEDGSIVTSDSIHQVRCGSTRYNIL